MCSSRPTTNYNYADSKIIEYQLSRVNYVINKHIDTWETLTQEYQQYTGGLSY